MKLIAQMNNWILQNFVIMKINNCLTRVNHFSTHHQFLAMWYCYDKSKYRIKWSFDLPLNWFILSPKELILNAITRTVNHNDVSKKLFETFHFLVIFRLFLKYIHHLIVCIFYYFHLLHDFIVTDKLLFFQFIYFDDAIPAAFYIDMICTSFFCLIFMC